MWRRPPGAPCGQNSDAISGPDAQHPSPVVERQIDVNRSLKIVTVEVAIASAGRAALVLARNARVADDVGGEGARRFGGRRSLFGNPGLEQPVENRLKLGKIRRIVAHRRPGGAGAGDGEGRVERETGLDRGMRLVQSAKLREGCAQHKMWLGIIPVCLYRPPKARCRVLPAAEVEPRHARDSHPEVSQRIARTEAQGLGNVSIRFFGATNKDLTSSDNGMGLGEISIQRQSVLAFGDALRSAPGEYVDNSQQQMCARMIWNRRQGFGQLRFGPFERRLGTAYKQKCALDRIRASRSNKRVNIVGTGRQRTIEEAARLRHIVGGKTLVEPSQTLKMEVHRVGVRRLFRASRLGG